MSIIQIDGGRRLYGGLKVHGAKNSVLPILAATLLNNGTSVIKNCPFLKDVEASIKILEHLGCHVTREGSTLIVNSRNMSRSDIPDALMREMRSSVIFLGAILARAGGANMSLPGGCELGARPIDLHLSALRQLGAIIDESGGKINCKAGNMRGAAINLAIPSVGATENIMLAASCCEGPTTITNAAKEPEIVDLQSFLVKMGVRVEGAGSSLITIQGKASLGDVEHKIVSDRIVAATYMSAVASAGGSVEIHEADPRHVSTVTGILREAGCMIREDENLIAISRQGALKSVKPIRTLPYPGFPTDAQSPLMAATLCAEGTTVFVENIFENRYRNAGEFLRMGADVRVEGRVALVCGVPKLHGANVKASDLRGGASLIVAALGAEGISNITGVEHIDRGYDRIEETLAGVGARIKRLAIESGM